MEPARRAVGLGSVVCAKAYIQVSVAHALMQRAIPFTSRPCARDVEREARVNRRRDRQTREAWCGVVERSTRSAAHAQQLRRPLLINQSTPPFSSPLSHVFLKFFLLLREVVGPDVRSGTGRSRAGREESEGVPCLGLRSGREEKERR